MDDHGLKASLGKLPPELLLQILYFIPSDSMPSVQLASKTLNKVAEGPHLWRYYCHSEFRYWDPSHEIRSKFNGPISATDWKGLYTYRRQLQRSVVALLDSILASQIGRLEKFQRVVDKGYDVKDALLSCIAVGNEVEDVLARRHWARALLDLLHRSVAIKIWTEADTSAEVTLDKAILAFDLFVLGDRPGDLAEVNNKPADKFTPQLIKSIVKQIDDIFDDLASQLRSKNKGVDGLTTKARALAVVGFLREKDLTGLGNNEYHDIVNNFIGLALQTENHPSLPLTSTAIFCGLAKRFNLDARGCSFPLHVHSMVFPAKSLSLDDTPLPNGEQAQPMYLDPFHSGDEVSLESLRRQLRELGIRSEESQRESLTDVSIPQLVIRAARNVMESERQEAEREQSNNAAHGRSRTPWQPRLIDPDSAIYSTVWATLLMIFTLPGEPGLNTELRRRYWIQFSHYFQTYFPGDVFLVEKYLVPLFEGLPEHAEVVHAVRVTRAGDIVPKSPRKRNTEHIKNHVRYKVGQIFRHQRYDYKAVIVGWNDKCEADERWVQAMGVDRLSAGRKQSFYHVMVEDNSVRYVAEENIEILTDTMPPPQILAMAGKFFKRWDAQSSAFVSNIRDQFPDD